MVKRIATASFLLATIATLPFAAAPAMADVAYVSTTGNNSNPCTLAKPCRSLQRGITVTPAGGEIHVLDSGFYGNNATINKSMTVVGNGHTITLGAPITVNRANATVALRRLVLNGKGSSARGIVVLAARAVHIEHCVVYGFSDDGIQIDTENSAAFVSDTVVRNNGGTGLLVIGHGSTKLTVDNSRFERNMAGISALFTESVVTRTISSTNVTGIYLAGGRMNVAFSTAANNSQGYAMDNGAHMVLESSVARGNSGNGLHVVGGSATISNSVFTFNGTGIFKGVPGVVLTRENNTVVLNGTNVSGSLSSLGGI